MIFFLINLIVFLLKMQNLEPHIYFLIINNQIMLFLLLPLTFFLIIQTSIAQNCCANVNCNIGQKCVCNNAKSQPYCLQEITQSKSSHPVNSTTKGFYYVPTQKQYNSIFVSACFNNPTTYEYIFLSISLENADQTFSFSSSTIYSSIILPGCLLFRIRENTFQSNDQNEYQNVLIFISVSSNNDIITELQIKTQPYQNRQSIIIPIMIGVGTLLFIVAASASIWFIYTRYSSRQLTNPNSTFPTGSLHLEKYMPSIQFWELKQKNIISEEVINCTVCLLDMTDSDIARRSPCGHIFHKGCIDQWCQKNLNCPLCRFPLDQQNLEKETKLVEESGAKSENNTQLLVAGNRISV